MAGVPGRPGLEGPGDPGGGALCGREGDLAEEPSISAEFDFIAKLLITNQCCQYRPQ